MRRVIKTFGHLLSPTFKRFYRALETPQQAQAQVQRRLIAQLRRCEYGQHYQINKAEDWHRLPIVTYDDLRSRLSPPTESSVKSTVKKTATRIDTTPDPILFYEPTSGSSGPRKQIPYTRALRQSFSHMFCLWAYDLITHGPRFERGKVYFSISPSFSKADASQGTTDDTEYLDRWLRWLLRPFLVMAPSTKTPEDFKDKLAQTLLKAADLEIISIWSPSFLTVHLDYIYRHRERLAAALEGAVAPERVAMLLQDEVPWARLWPGLKLISCWDSVMAADGADALRSRFPQTLVQGKGLLATEAPMTVPLIVAKGHVPLLTDVYFEFEASDGQCYPLHQLQVGQTYEVIISQMGGLYRYRMGDRVKATHYFLNTPCLEFVGRSQSVSDLVGEKLHIQFVSDVLVNLGLPPSGFQSLVPVRQPQAHYVLLLDQWEEESDAIAEPLDNCLASQLEKALCESFHYQLARQLGQLAPAQVLVSATVAEQLAEYHLTDGQRWGDIKHPKLSTKSYRDLSFISG